MTDPIPVGEDDLQAHLDRRLPAERARVVEAYLAAHPDVAARLRRYCEQEAVLADALRSKLEEPVPARLRVSAILARRRGMWALPLRRTAAVVLLLGAGGLGGWYANAWTGRAGPLHAATVTAVAGFRAFSVEQHHPVEVRASERSHLVQWLSSRLRRPLTVPDLSALGFRLMGGRLLPTAHIPAAQLMYDNDRGTRLTVYVQPMGIAGTDFRYAQANGVRTVYWGERRLAFAVTARTSRAVLLAAARRIYDQMQARDPDAAAPR